MRNQRACEVMLDSNSVRFQLCTCEGLNFDDAYLAFYIVLVLKLDSLALGVTEHLVSFGAESTSGFAGSPTRFFSHPANLTIESTFRRFASRRDPPHSNANKLLPRAPGVNSQYTTRNVRRRRATSRTHSRVRRHRARLRYHGRRHNPLPQRTKNSINPRIRKSCASKCSVT